MSAVTVGGGLIALNGGNVVYTPAANFNGLFVFDYTVRDNGSTAGVVDARSATVRSTISIAAVNDAPVPGGDTIVGVNEDVDNFPISIAPLLSNDAPGPATATDEASPNQTVSFVGLVNGSVVGNNGVSTNGGVVTTDGNVIFYSPADDFFGTDYIPYVITDNGVPAMTATGTITVTVAAVNDPPVANDDQKPGAEDTPLSFLASDLTVNDLKGPANESSQTLTVIGFGSAASPSLNTVTSRGGSATLDTQTGQIQYTPAPNVSGNDTFIYVVEDSGTAAGGGSDKLRDTATVTISVAERNDTPEPMDDLTTVGEDPVGDLTITFASLLLNDSAGPGESPTSAPPQNLFVSGPTSTFTSAAGGTVMVDSANSRFLYHPPADFFGADHFVYLVTDDGTTFGSPDPKSSSATVFINVTQANDPPVPTNDHFDTPEESTATITAVQLTGNDLAGPLNESQGSAAQTLTLLGPETLAANANNQTAQGALISINGGVVEVDYSGLVNFVGVDTFFYVIEDNGTTNGTLAPLRATGVATVTVTAVNDAPIASNDDLRTTLSSTEALEDSDITIAASLVLANDAAGPSTAADELNGSQTVTLVDVAALSGQGGSVQLLGGSIVYHGPVDFVGEDIITYVIEDNGTTDGAPDPLRATGQITISVHPVNDPPVAGDDVVAATEDEPIVFSTLLANDFPGPATAIDEQSPAQTLSIVGVTMLAPGGTIQVVNGTEVEFTPAPDFNGFTSFRYTVQDDGSPARVATATVSVQVLAKNDPPIPGTDNRSTPENLPLVISETSLLANDLKGPADESNQSLTIPATAGAVAVLPGDVGKILVSRSAGSITVTPIGEFNGEARFTYVVQDNGTPSLSATGTVVVTVTPVNDPPVPVDDHFTTDEDTQLSFNVSALLAGALGSNDVPGPSNESSQNLIVRSVAGPSAAGGSVVFNNQTGAVNYTPPLNFAGVDTFSYVVEDDGFSGPNPDPRSATGTITVTVNPINDAPSFTKGSDQTVNEDAGAQTVPGWASNIAAGPLTATDELQNQQVGFQISTSDDALFSMLPAVDGNGQLTYTTALNANGAAIVTVQAVDSEGGASPPQTFTITVRPLNDPPSFALLGNVTVAEESGPYQADGFASAILPGPLGAVDELGQLVTFNVTNNNNGLFSAQPAIDSAGRLTFTPAADAFGAAVVTVVGRDTGSNEAPNSNTTSPRTFTISITEQNDPPVAVDDHYS
ncbi:MAG: tandem-95 repeat protein, partial [Planctomycetales bacterium]|nr:tandem-95 repeat protein [Planctomycetales bacterium]